MTKKLLIAFYFLLLSGDVFSQQPSIHTIVQKGNQLFDDGKYIEALEQYKRALALDPEDPDVNVEMGNTYVALKKYQEAVPFCDKVIGLNKEGSAELGYTIKGTALDLMEKPDEALKVYLYGIRKYPKCNSLLYNVSVTYYKMGKYTESAHYAGRAVEAKPAHASSHLMLWTSMYALDRRVQSLLACYYFLFLEPNSRRSPSALNAIDQQLKSGVKQKDDKNIEINVSENAGSAVFGAAELALSMAQASKYEDKEKNKTEEQAFFEVSELLFSILGQLKDKNTDDNNSIWWTQYVPFFKDMNDSKNTEAFCYYITTSKNSANVKAWINNHSAKMYKFAKWSEKYRSGN